MPTASQLHAVRVTVVVVFIASLIFAFAGYRYRNAQVAAQVTWQDVSATLQDVETAKRELFESMQQKTGNL